MHEFLCRALLLDIDGTLVDSLPAVDRAWTEWARRHGMNPEEVLTQIHGKRSLDSIRRLRPDLDAETENVWLRNAEATDTAGVVAVPGAVELIRELPPGSFAVVTSGTSDVAHARLGAVGIQVPSFAVYGEDVTDGKPHPAPYLLAAQRLNVEPAQCLVFEDSAAGVQSGKAAGMKVVGIATYDEPDTLASADAIAPNFLAISVVPEGDQLKVVVR